MSVLALDRQIQRLPAQFEAVADLTIRSERV